MASGFASGLTMVTLTGADDATNPADLAEMSAEFPFVEWGILIGSHSGTGSSRFPSLRWIESLCEERFLRGNAMQLSLHICGRYLRDIATGRTGLVIDVGPRIGSFDRCQLNWHGERQDPATSENVLGAFCRMAPWEPEIIFQLDGVNDDLMAGCLRRFRCGGLFDVSHGAGVLPTAWPQSRVDCRCGWAGGLGPKNVVEQLAIIRQRAYGPFWIDMETQVRTGGEFDLQKCRAVLEALRPFVA